MKTTILLLALIVLNTSALLSETLAVWVKGIDAWLLIAFEIVLLITLYLHHLLKGLHEISNVDFSGIEHFVIKSKDKSQGKP
jgi:succinate dehydrogenase/fumarate reductase cytochrome b subunit